MDLDQVSANAAGQVVLNTRGSFLPTITATALEALAEDASLRVSLFDGARPLASSAKRNVSRADVARAGAWAREQPGATAQADPRELATKEHQTYVHKWDWSLTLDPDTGIVTARNSDQVYRSIPRSTRLEPPEAEAPEPPEPEPRPPP